MKRDLIDFHEVPAGQMAMHERLENWGRVCNSGPADSTAPMFRQFQSSDARTVAYELTVAPPPDRRDAVKVGQGVAALPLEHRLAVQWHYVQRTSVARGRRALGCTAEALHRYVCDGRRMLINRGI